MKPPREAAGLSASVHELRLEYPSQESLSGTDCGDRIPLSNAKRLESFVRPSTPYRNRRDGSADTNWD